MDSYQTIQVRFEEPICHITFHRPEARNTINARLIEECNHALKTYGPKTTVVVLEGSPEVFCFGADFQSMRDAAATGGSFEPEGPGPLYDLWLQLATGPYITVAHVRGAANAGGIGFVAASDIVVADATARFSLSEMLFGVLPACVLPFLIRRIGFQRANYLTLMTQPIGVEQAASWGLVDAYEPDSATLLRRHLLRVRRLSKPAVARYKKYNGELAGFLKQWKSSALAANVEAFSDKQNMEGIFRYVDTGKFPWEP
jgi:polyketide biosynthesis enoyl-CoA hydratase PksH